MANSIKVVVNTGKQETTQTVDVLQGNGDAGQPTRIKAVKGARYQLEDPALKNTGPQHLRTKRIGKSLHITLDGSTESDLIIDDYYDEAFQGDGGGGIYGRAEDGSIYEYIPQDASQEGKLMELADGGSPVDQVLGADPVEDFELSALPLAAAAGGGLGIGGVAAGVAGAGALAGGGGGGAGTTATTAEADAALAAVKNFAESNGSGLTAATGTAPTEATYSTAGVTGVTTQNVGAINSALASAAVNGAKVDTVAKLQALVDAYRAILDEANGTAEDATPNADPSAAQYEAVGVTGVDAGAEETLLGDVIGSKVAADVDTVEELQALADAVGATVGYTGTQTGPSVSQLNALTGASSVTPDNLAAVQAAIAKANASGAPITSQAALKALIDTATQNYQAALDAIKAAAENNTATQANPSVAQYEALGVHGVSASNLAAINTALDSAAVNAAAADTAAKVQAIVDGYNAILAAADGVDKNMSSVPTQTHYASVGVTGVDTKVKADLLSDVVDGKAKADVDTVQELQDLANAVGATVGYTGTQTGPTDGQLNALTGENTVTPDNLAAVKAAIAQANGGSKPITTQEQLKAIIAAAVESYQAALDAIKAAAENNTATLTSPSAEQYAAAGVVGVTPSNLGAMNSALNSAVVNGAAADTAGEVQGIVSAYKAILAAADGVDNNATKPTQGNYASVGVTGVDSPVKATLLSDVVDSKTNADVDTVQELQDLANAVGATVGYTGGQTGPTDGQLNALTGGSSVTPDNLAAIKAAIAQANGGSTPITTQEQIKAIIAAAVQGYQSALDAIKAAAENNTATLTSPSAEQYAAAGVVGVTPSNLGAMNSALNSAVVNGAAADTAGEVQGIVSAYKAILAAADGVDNNAANPTQTQYALIGVDGVNTAQKESLLGDVIDIQATDAVDTVDEVQALVNVVSAVMSGEGGGTAPTLEQLQALGLQNVNSNNIALVQAAIAATSDTGSDVDTLAKLQALITVELHPNLTRDLHRILTHPI